MIEERLTDNSLARVINISAYKTKRIENDERLADLFEYEPSLNDSRRFFILIISMIAIALISVKIYLQ
jgi:hypothetical protein